MTNLPSNTTVAKMVQVVTDTIADIPPELARTLDIMMVPVHVRFATRFTGIRR